MPMSRTCTDCGAPLSRARRSQGWRRCSACAGSARAADTSADGLADGELSRDDRVEANRQIAQAMRFMTAVKGFYATVAVVVGLAFLVALTRDTSPAVLIVLGVTAAAAAGGALEVRRNPVPWSFGLALGLTGFHAAMFLLDSGARGVSGVRGLVGWAVIVVACWTAFGMARSAERIARAYPGLRMARRLRGLTIEDELGPVSTKYADRARAERKTRRKRRLVVAGLMVAALSTVVVLAMNAGAQRGAASGYVPPPVAVDFYVAKFRTAWNANRLDEVKAMFVPEWRRSYARIMDRNVERHAWKTLPALPPPKMSYEGWFAAAYFEIPGERGTLYTSWAYDEPSKSWLMNRLRAPGE